jgi:hypothetical protein
VINKHPGHVAYGVYAEFQVACLVVGYVNENALPGEIPLPLELKVGKVEALSASEGGFDDARGRISWDFVIEVEAASYLIEGFAGV